MAARPRAAEARETRRDLIEAALELFAEKGFYGVSLRDIARAVGVQQATIYHHFASKEALFEAVIADPVGEGVHCGPPALPEFSGGPDDLPAYLERILLLTLEKFALLKERKRFKVLLTDGVRLAQEGKVNYFERTAALREPMLRVFASLMDRGYLRRQDPMLVGMLFIAPVLLWRQLLVTAPGHPFVEQYRTFARVCVEQFLQGAMAAPPPGSEPACPPPSTQLLNPARAG